ncbi:protein TIC 62, chloroplastic-like [Camellia sinensis]|uniref:protein TIC 62, chloroplastic-like n=1 Tax=Camellia sinensis TaxID=4442 RepID=UPI001036AEDB|nr:protein TIC 62, chloroplastic-like [Camellia sinensis]
MAFMAKKRSISYCKVVEVIAETTAPLTPVGELLVKIPSQRVEIKPLKESDTAGGPQSSKSVVSEPPLSAPVEKEPAIEKAVAASPLSPYIVYEDLKPPTSPTPTPSTSAGATQASHVEGISSALKIAPSSTQINISESPSTVTEKENVQTEVKKKTPLSPYAKYVNFPCVTFINLNHFIGYLFVFCFQHWGFNTHSIKSFHCMIDILQFSSLLQTDHWSPDKSRNLTCL